MGLREMETYRDDLYEMEQRLDYLMEVHEVRRLLQKLIHMMRLRCEEDIAIERGG